MVIHQAPLSKEFSRQEYWSVILFPSPENLPNPRIKPGSSALQADSLLSDTGWQYTALVYFFSSFEPVCCSMSGSNYFFLTYLKVFQKTGKMVWYSHLFSLKSNIWILVLACSYVNINVQYFSSLFWATGSKTLGKQTNKYQTQTTISFTIWKWKCYFLSHVWLFVTPGLYPTRFLCLWNSPGRILEWVAIPFSRGYSWSRD